MSIGTRNALSWASARHYFLIDNARAAIGRVIPTTGATNEMIRKLEEERNQVIVHGDAAAQERMTSDDYAFVTLRGEMLGKAEIVRNSLPLNYLRLSGASKYLK